MSISPISVLRRVVESGPDDEHDRAFAGIAFYAVGVGLALVSLPLAEPGTNRNGVLVVTAAAFVFAAVLLAIHRSVPAWAWNPLGGLSTLIITADVALSGTPSTPYALFYIWIAIWGLYFFEWHTGWKHVAFAATAYAAALLWLGGSVSVLALHWLLVMGTALSTGVVVSLLRARADRAQRRLEQLANEDPLTGLANRRAFTTRLEAALAAAAERREPVALVLVDVDHFKAVNDRHGHPTGDAVLRRLGTALRAHARANDTVGRIGGEEFALVLPGAGSADAAAIAERIRCSVARSGAAPEVTVSLGVAAFPDEASSADRLLAAADAALYRAKAGGRNCVVAAAA